MHGAALELRARVCGDDAYALSARPCAFVRLPGYTYILNFHFCVATLGFLVVAFFLLSFSRCSTIALLRKSKNIL